MPRISKLIVLYMLSVPFRVSPLVSGLALPCLPRRATPRHASPHLALLARIHLAPSAALPRVGLLPPVDAGVFHLPACGRGWRRIERAATPPTAPPRSIQPRIEIAERFLRHLSISFHRVGAVAPTPAASALLKPMRPPVRAPCGHRLRRAVLFIRGHPTKIGACVSEVIVPHH